MDIGSCIDCGPSNFAPPDFGWLLHYCCLNLLFGKFKGIEYSSLASMVRCKNISFRLLQHTPLTPTWHGFVRPWRYKKRVRNSPFPTNRESLKFFLTNLYGMTLLQDILFFKHCFSTYHLHHALLKLKVWHRDSSLVQIIKWSKLVLKVLLRNDNLLLYFPL